MYLDLPSGLAIGVKQTLLKEVAEYIDDAFMIADMRSFLRE
jgi:hypothetical protein